MHNKIKVVDVSVPAGNSAQNWPGICPAPAVSQERPGHWHDRSFRLGVPVICVVYHLLEI